MEPFAGSCSLFFRLSPRRALLADKNKELIEVYEVLRRKPTDLYKAVTSFAPESWVYNQVRALQLSDLPVLERAARFIYLNRNCFNGIFRTNQTGGFNVPFARCRQGAVPSLSEFRAASRLLNDVELRAWDFGTTLRYCGKGDFVYLDPPYLVDARRVFREYGPRAFSSCDLQRLANHLEKLDERGAIFLLSYADSREARALARNWNSRRVSVRRNIAGFASDRKQGFELLITNSSRKAANGN